MDIPTFIKNNKQLFRKLSLAFGMFLVASIGFAMLADEVHEGETLQTDEMILRSIHANASPALDSFFPVYTEIGGVIFVAAITMIIVGYLWFSGRRYKSLLLFFAVGGAALANYTVKFLFERARPDLWTHLVDETSFSFPSGHAMGSSAFAFGIVAILWNTKWRWPAMFIAAMYVISIGFSRLYLGVHYPTDILAGWLLSLVWVAFIASFIYIRMHRKDKTA
jgi:membrane-associated phospholipid phosphatase